ncbi:hypothetical protein TKK_0012551 [Trichogramma kaykai]|uniref:Pre-rRNA-processing protein TSR1 homolog n=1 Tax=Trichogramma kaykai TaxID=54128 RepID=A0ABD2WMQ9_9HYME
MGLPEQDNHRPGVFKKPNKVHKTGRHRSKGSVAGENKGRTGVKSLSKSIKKDLGREARRNQLQQIRSHKREEVLKKKRSLGSAHSAPIVIAVIPLQEDLQVEAIVELFISADEEATVRHSASATHISIPRFKQRFAIVVPTTSDVLSTLDVAKVATTVIFVTSAVYDSDKSQRNEVLDAWGEEIIQPVISQGLSTPIIAAVNIETLPVKKRQDYKNHVQKTLFKWIPEEKIMPLDKPADALNILRRAGSQKQRSVAYKNKRSYLLAEDVKFNLDEKSKNNFGTLKVSGYLQGLSLSVNGLVHIPGFGDFQMSQIEKCRDPFPLTTERQNLRDEEMQEDRIVIAVADPEKQESLTAEHIPDPMDAEQTWPTDEELALAEAKQTKKIMKRVPKGTSEYQAAWIPDVEGEEYVEDYSDEEDDMTVDEAQSEVNSDDMQQGEDDDEEYETISISESTNEQRYDEKMDMYEEREAMLKLQEAKLDSQYPDEVDTPLDTLAKDRFQKYRGLESFKNTPWDNKENLPFDYGRIYQFENFERTRKRIFNERLTLDEVQPGTYITIHVKNVSQELFEAYRVLDQPLILFGLLENEHKMSVLNFVLKRTANCDIPIKSKERLIFQCGYRRFTACPIFSQHTNGNKHKFERYFQPKTTMVASVFAPITFPPSPVLCYQEKKDGSLELLATGTLLSVTPDRMVIKRVVLSGYPFKVNKKSAVIRFMFYNREDIIWFKPVKLRTKCGRKGHIKEPLGTHGHMKCIFDGQLNSQDTVFMNLYKRVFPKWTYEPMLLNITSTKPASMDM